jgi:hypothetical protein
MYDGGAARQSGNLSSNVSSDLSSLVLMRLQGGLFFFGAARSSVEEAVDDDVGITPDSATGIELWSTASLRCPHTRPWKEPARTQRGGRFGGELKKAGIDP